MFAYEERNRQVCHKQEMYFIVVFNQPLVSISFCLMHTAKGATRRLDAKNKEFCKRFIHLNFVVFDCEF